MTTTFYKIRTITNLHVGAGDANYGVIDNLVQRDVVTGLPVIHGSSLKGAIREFYEYSWGGKDERLLGIFGDNDRAANFRFLEANLLAIPVRSNKKPYFLAVSSMVLKSLKTSIHDHGTGGFNLDPLLEINPEKGKPVVFGDTSELVVEEYESVVSHPSPQSNSTLLGDFSNIVIFNDEDFNELCSDTGLPVIARNKLGENKNLWYEQVVPRESLFWFGVIHNEKHFDEFNALLTDPKSLIHIGANATVGYGFTKISKI